MEKEVDLIIKVPEERIKELYNKYPGATREISENIAKYEEKFNLNKEFAEKCDWKFYIQSIGEMVYFELPEEKKEEDLKSILNECYEKIIEVLKEYSDLEEINYKLIAVWILGTYFHNQFSTYPYLFLNAMKGSGKTRLLRLIAAMSFNGKVLLSPTEAVMFRIPKGHTVCLDEMENLMKKDSAGLREMLNACYKKGSTVYRMKQKKINGSSEQVVEEFEPYKPICIANINGVDSVLEDRCISLIIERSDNQGIMKIQEDFEENPKIKWIKSGLESNLVQLCSYVQCIEELKQWNIYIKFKYFKTTLTTQTTESTLNSDKEELFNKINSSDIIGRNLELFFPLIMLSSKISDSVVNEVLEIAKKLDLDKRKNDETESKDKSLYDYVSRQTDDGRFYKIKLFLIGFRNFMGDVEDYDDKWLNEKWLGKALKRLNLIVDKRRMGSGIEVTLDVKKAKQKIGRE